MIWDSGSWNNEHPLNKSGRHNKMQINLGIVRILILFLKKSTLVKRGTILFLVYIPLKVISFLKSVELNNRL